MLAYFPVPYNDELLYSCIARYAVHTGQVDNQKAILRDVFGTGGAAAIPDLPSHLRILTKKLGWVWPTSVKRIIENHTLAPIYLPFMPEAQARKIVESMASSKGGNIHTRAGIVANCISPPMHFRYCPACAHRQNNELGELYWRRVHQLPGVWFCGQHGCALEKATAYFRPKEKHRFYSAMSECSLITGRYSKINMAEQCLLEKYTELLTDPEIRGNSFARWTQFYIKLARELGLVRKTRVCHQQIYQRVKRVWKGSHYDHYLLAPSDRQWLIDIFRKHRKSFHPIRHLMVIVALLPDAKMRNIISTVRKLPATTPSSNALPKLWPASEHAIIKHRHDWLKLIVQNPNKGVQQLRSVPGGSRLYSWLYRNDKLWLMTNRPERVSQPQQSQKIDYQVWDIENIYALRKAFASMRNLTARGRLTRSHLLKILPRANSVEKHLDDLPMTKQWLTSHAETVEDYQIFRLRLVGKKLKDLNLKVKRWRLLRVAGIRKELVTSKIEYEIYKLENLTRDR